MQKKFIEIATTNCRNISIAVSSDGVHYLWGSSSQKFEQEKTDFQSIIHIFNVLGEGSYKTINLHIRDFLPLMRYSKYNHEFNESKLISWESFGIVSKAMNQKDKNFTQ